MVKPLFIGTISSFTSEFLPTVRTIFPSRHHRITTMGASAVEYLVNGTDGNDHKTGQGDIAVCQNVFIAVEQLQSQNAAIYCHAGHSGASKPGHDFIHGTNLLLQYQYESVERYQYAL